jgi:hypothetical protein
MQSIAMPPVLDALSVEERRALLADPAMASLQGVFAAVPDPRARRGRRYDLPFLLTCLVAALLSDCNSLDAVGQWCAEHRAVLARRYPHARFLTPSGALFRWLLPRLSVAEFEWALATRMRSALQVRLAAAISRLSVMVSGAMGGRWASAVARDFRRQKRRNRSRC